MTPNDPILKLIITSVTAVILVSAVQRPDNLQVIGVIAHELQVDSEDKKDDDKQGVAVLRDRNTQRTWVVRTGDKVDDRGGSLIVARVVKDGVVLEAPTGGEVLLSKRGFGGYQAEFAAARPSVAPPSRSLDPKDPRLERAARREIFHDDDFDDYIDPFDDGFRYSDSEEGVFRQGGSSRSHRGEVDPEALRHLGPDSDFFIEGYDDEHFDIPPPPPGFGEDGVDEGFYDFPSDEEFEDWQDLPSAEDFYLDPNDF